MLDSWEICQPSAWAFQTMPHNVLDSPEKQPGAWKLPAHHLNSLIWALSGSPSLPPLPPSLPLFHSVCSSLGITLYISFSLLIHPPSSHFLSHGLSLSLPLKSIPPSIFFFHFAHSICSDTCLVLHYFAPPSTKKKKTSPCHGALYLFFTAFSPLGSSIL